MSESVVDPGSPGLEPEGDRLSPWFVLAVALIAILVSVVVTLVLLSSLQTA